MQQYVAGFMFDEKKEIVAVVEKRRPAWQAGKLNAIGGKIEPGESSVDAMVREFQEETGVATTREDWRFEFSIRDTDYKYIVYFYSSFSDLVHYARTIEEEQIYLFTVKDFPYEDALPNLRWMVPMVLEDRQYQVLIRDAMYFNC